FGALKLKHLGRIPLSHTTINRVLHETQQAEKRPRKQRRFKRFERPYSNYLWQLDTCQVATVDDGWVYVQTLLDDHSRFILASHALAYAPTQADSIRLVARAMRMWGAPRQGLTDNGQEFHSIQREEPGLFTRFLHEHGVQHIRGRPHHPRTQGKIERWHRSLKHEWLAYRNQPADCHELRRQLFEWLEFYNSRRPHSALGLRTPVEVHLESLILTGRLDPAVNEVP
ncbi:MAG: integrase core domain-containing protein, partial [bacterium]